MADDPSKSEHVPNCSQETLWALYHKNGFADLLKKCEQKPIVPRRPRKPEETRHAELTEFEEGTKYKDPIAGYTVAVIFRYTDIADNVTTTIRMLRVGNKIFDAASRPSVAPPVTGGS